MKKLMRSQSLAVGLAMFSMFFGAGNIIFPLAVGQYAQDKNSFAIFGLIVTAALMPIAGVIAMILYDGNTKAFFGRIGKFPGFILALTTISLLGPLGSTPRCIALAYTTLTSSFLTMSPVTFSAIACVIIFLFTFKKNHILTLLGWVLTPALLLSLFTIIVLGYLKEPTIGSIESSGVDLFMHGLKEGYNTMDLLAAFFFSSSIIHVLKLREEAQTESENAPKQKYIRTAMRASFVGAFLLTVIYIGFSYLAAFHGSDLYMHGKDALLMAITNKIAGPYAGMLVSITIALACLTTAIALIVAFADFVQTEVFNKRVDYILILAGSLLLTFFVSTFEFKGISAFLGPVLQICYPGLIVLTFLNIAHKLYGFKPVKWPVFLTFAASAIVYYYEGLA